MEQRYIDIELGAVTLRESHRAKNLSIKVNRCSGAVTVVFPVGYNKSKAIAFLEQKRLAVKQIIERSKKAEQACQSPAPSYDIEELRRRAIEYLPSRIEELARQTNLKYNKLTLSVARTRWGSCSSENNISLSIFLMILPLHLIDFVILHELCHTVHHNHSKEFHATLNYLVSGREKIYIKELKAIHIC